MSKGTIRIILTLITIQLAINTISGQENNIVFTYDKGGNMTQRKVQVLLSGRLGNFNNLSDTSIVELPAFKIYPNPTNQFLNVEGNLPENVTEANIALLNINGQVLKTGTYSGELKTIPVSDLKAGLYLLEIEYSKKKRTTYKIVITN